MKLFPWLIRPTVTSRQLPGLVFYWALRQENVQLHHSTSIVLSLFAVLSPPGKADLYLPTYLPRS